MNWFLHDQSMSIIEWTIRESRALESLLEERYGARGRGLHEKISDVNAQLPRELTKRLRFVATIRNRLVHEDGFEPTSSECANLRSAVYFIRSRLDVNCPTTENAPDAPEPDEPLPDVWRDDEGFDANGYDADGYNRKGYDRSGIDREGWTKAKDYRHVPGYGSTQEMHPEYKARLEAERREQWRWYNPWTW